MRPGCPLMTSTRSPSRTASRGSEVAQESERLRHGAFTYYVLKGGGFGPIVGAVFAIQGNNVL